MKTNWDLTEIFNSWEEWDKTHDLASKSIKKLESYQGKLDNFETLKEFYNLYESTLLDLYNVYIFAHLNNDLNKKDTFVDGKFKQAHILYSAFMSATSFVEPELIQIGEEKINEFVSKDEKLQEYKFGFDNLFRLQSHVLSTENEKIISNFSPLMDSTSNLYSSLTISDKVNTEVTLSTGETIKVTSGNYRSYLADLKEQDDRRKVFEAIFNYYGTHKNTYAAIYNSILQKNWANAKSRNYSSSIESYLFKNNIPVSVYESLINTTKSTTEPIKKYIELRKKHLNIEEYRTYDRFVPLSESNEKYKYEEGLEIFYKSLEKMPKEFKEFAKRALADGNVDVYEADGKETGAYSSGLYGHKPHILLNYDDTLSYVFTVAHEAGHSIHTILSQENQPFATSNYTIFVAEIASTFNEHLLLDYLVENAKTRDEQIVLLTQAIDDILGTFYRQSLFADYEYQAHKLVEDSKPVTTEALSNIMIDLYKQYYGIDIKEEKVKEFVWAYIPHMFHTPFYVYQYATSYAASLKIYDDVKNNVDGAYDKYMSLLKSGGSKYPVDQVKEAGVDLTTEVPFKAVVDRLESLVNKLEEIL